jgi:hypothetical protein
MAISREELELQGIEYLPAREVMSACITGPTGSQVGSYDLFYAPLTTDVEGNHHNAYGDGSFNGWNVQVVGDTAAVGQVLGGLPLLG